MRTILLLAAVLLAPIATTPAASEIPDEQSVTAVAPSGEQRIEAVAPAGEQHVQALDPAGMQQVSGGHKGPVRRGAEATGKVVLGVLAAVVSVGVMAASLLLL